jgi:hypothetical protein
MSSLTVAMLVAVKVTDNALNNLGNYPLSVKEKEYLEASGFSDENIKEFNEFLKAINYYE